MVLSNFLPSALTKITCSQSSKLRSGKERTLGLGFIYLDHLAVKAQLNSKKSTYGKQFLCVEKTPHSRSRSAWQLLGEAHLGLLGTLGEENKSQVNPVVLP